VPKQPNCYILKKQSSWQNFCSSITRTTPIKEVWAFAKGFKFKSTSSLAPITTNIPMDSSLFLDKIWPMDSSPPTTPPSITHRDDHWLHSDFTFPELESVLSSLHDSAPGLDTVSYSMLQHLPPKGRKVLLQLFNDMWSTGDHPPEWQDILVKPILKPGKPSNDHNSYRPIALTSCIRKCYEHLIKSRLQYFVENKSLIPAMESAYRRGRGTLDNLVSLTTDIQIASTTNQKTICLFFDISGAFDNVNFEVLFQRAREIGIPNSLCQTLHNLLFRKNIILTSSPTGSRESYHGLPQGSVLSPDLFTIHTLSLRKAIPLAVEVLKYSDDLVMYVSCHDVRLGIAQLEEACTAFSSWLVDSKLTINPEKISAMVFSPRNFDTSPLTIRFNSSNIKFSNTKKFLGITLDTRLTWSPHILNLQRACHKATNIICATCRTWWGADPVTLLTLYKSLVRSKIEYASPLFFNANSDILRKLDVCQNNALRAATGAFKSSPIPALLSETGIHPLKARVQSLVDKYVLNQFRLTNNPIIDTMTSLDLLVQSHHKWTKFNTPIIIRSLYQVSPLVSGISRGPTLPCFSYPYFSYSYPVNHKVMPTVSPIPENCTTSNPVFHEYCDQHWPHCSYHVFTDGSKSSDSVGAAFVIPHIQFTYSYKLPNNASIFTTEATALVEAILFLLRTGVKEAVIHSDSRSVLMAVQGTPTKGSINWHIPVIKSLLCSSSKFGFKYHLSWVKAHAKVPGNEAADACAKSAALSGRPVSPKLPCTDLYPVLNQHFIMYSNDLVKVLWEGKTSYSRYQIINPSFRSSPWF
jgi:ribonuclease HI